MISLYHVCQQLGLLIAYLNLTIFGFQCLVSDYQTVDAFGDVSLLAPSSLSKGVTRMM